MRCAFLVVLLVVTSCRREAGETTLYTLGDHHPGRERAVAVTPPGDRGKVQYHMRARLADLRRVEVLLARGRLDEAKALAFMLSRPVRDPGLGRLSAEAARMSAAALALAGATSFDEASRLAPRVAAACASCHARAGVDVEGLARRRVARPSVLLRDQRFE